MNGEGQTLEGQSANRGLKDNVKDSKTTCGASIQNTPPLKALIGVRVVASLLGHSSLEMLCSLANTQVGQWSHNLGTVARYPEQEHAKENAPSEWKKGIG